MITKRKKKSPDFADLQREIARRLQVKLPLAGMLAATALLCGCNERPPRGPIGKMPAKNAAQCEQKPELPKEVSAPPKKNGNRERLPNRTVGIPREESNERNETVTAGGIGPIMGVVVMPPTNQKNEKKQPITPGRAAKKVDK